jgi:drug/metabolite transporter (DMT)-like permease
MRPRGTVLRLLSYALLVTTDQTAAARDAPAVRTGVPPASPAATWVALGIVYVVWGSTYLGIRVAVRTIPPFVMGGARFVLAGVLLYGIARVRGAQRWVTPRELASCALAGTLLAAGGNGIVNLAERYIESGPAALVIAAVPLWVVLMRRVTGERIRLATLLSVAAGFVGVGLLLAPGGVGGSNPTLGFFLVLLASFSWALGSFVSPRLTLPADGLLSTAIQMACGGLVLSLGAVATGEVFDFHPGNVSGESLAAYLYLVLIGSLVAYTAYVWLLQNAPISRVATYAYVNPTIAIFLGWAILGEHVGGLTLVGAGIVIASVAVTVRKETG